MVENRLKASAFAGLRRDMELHTVEPVNRQCRPGVTLSANASWGRGIKGEAAFNSRFR